VIVEYGHAIFIGVFLFLAVKSLEKLLFQVKSSVKCGEVVEFFELTDVLDGLRT
jgi:hypothetical protein